MTLGGDKNYDTRDVVSTAREMRITPHVAQNNTSRSSAIDGRTTRHKGYEISQQKLNLFQFASRRMAQPGAASPNAVSGQRHSVARSRSTG